MTVPSSVAKSGPYDSNGVTDVFNYDFRIVDEAHLTVILTSTADEESTLTLATHYTVSGVGDQSGSINLTSAGLALAVSGTKITILRNPPFTQDTDLQNQGPYLAQTVEDRFDLITMQVQTIKERSDRSIAIPASDEGTTLDDLTEDLIRIADSADNIDTVAGIETEVGTVAGISTEVTTVSGISTEVQTVAARDADIGTVAARDLDIGTVADRDIDIGTVAGVADDVATVAGISTDVSTVAGISADVSTVADNVADVTNFADVYLGASATAPTTRTDGSALVAGDQYFDTTENKLKVWAGSAWIGGTGDILSTNNGSDFADPAATLDNLGGMAEDTYDPTGQAANAFNGFPVASRAALQALSTASFTTAYLREDGREGTFEWDGTDRSVAVAADTTQSTFVAPTADATGVSGAWVRRRKGPVLITEAGVSETGDPDINSQLIESLMDYFSLTGISGGELVVPYGTFEFANHSDNAAFRLGSGVTLMGFGEKSILRLADNQNDCCVVRPFADSSGVRLRNLCLDGNRAGQSAPTGLLGGFIGAPNGKNIRLNEVLIKDVYERAFMSSLEIDLDTRDSYDVHLSGCRAVNYGGKAWQITRTQGASVVGNFAHSTDADSSAFEVSQSEGVSVSANTSVDEGTGVNHYRIVNGSDTVTVTGNNGRGGSRMLMCTNCTNIEFVGNNGRDTVDGMLIQHYDLASAGYILKNVSVKANKFKNFGGSGIRVDVDADFGTAVENVSIYMNEFENGTIGLNLSTGEDIDVREALNQFIGVTTPKVGVFRPNDKFLVEGVISGSITNLATDTAASVSVPSVTGMMEFVVETIPVYSASFSYRSQAAAASIEQAWNISPTVIEKSTGVLTGTTGTAGKLTVSVHTDGNLYFENRTPATRTIRYFFRCTA